MSKLFSPLTVKNTVFRNRIVVSPMCQPGGRITYGDLGIWKAEHVDKLKQIVAFLHGQGAKAGIQLAHAGRKASCELPWKGGAQIASDQDNGCTTVSAGPVAFIDGQEAPDALDEAGIKKVIAAFVDAAKRAKPRLDR